MKIPILLTAFALFILLTFMQVAQTQAATAQNTSHTIRNSDIPLVLLAAADSADDFEDDFEDDDYEDDYEDEGSHIADPIEPFNRAMFVFNDKLYFWILKPAARGYNRVLPEPGRVGVKRFFLNIRTPIRLVNALLQGKVDHAFHELFRFGVNTTYGILGFRDPANDKFGIALHREDTGQTLGVYGLGPGFYIVWPFLGPSSLRDTAGMFGDAILNPTTYVFAHTDYEYGSLVIDAYRRFNIVSLNLGFYEGIKKDSLDPYIYIRNGYHQHREHLIKE